jgi:hypothetical protein
VKYMLLIYHDEQPKSDAERQACYAESAQLADELKRNGQFLAANPLHPPSTAKRVRLRNGRRVMSDGPFAETREQLGGYFLVDVKTLDDALGIAERIPMARQGTVEVRQVIEVPGMPFQAAEGSPATSHRR